MQAGSAPRVENFQVEPNDEDHGPDEEYEKIMIGMDELKHIQKSEKVIIKLKRPDNIEQAYVFGIRRDNGLWIDLTDVQRCFPTAMGLTHEDGKYLSEVIVYTGAQGDEYTVWIHDSSGSADDNKDKTYNVGLSCKNIGLNVGMCFSGGGYRATVFHLGAIRRMNQLGLLQKIDTFSSVSGGSITNAILASEWDNLIRNDFSDAAFEYFIRQPILRIATQFNMVSDVAFTQDLKRVWRSLTGSAENGANDLARRYIYAEEYVKKQIQNDADMQEIKRKYKIKGDFQFSLSNSLAELPHGIFKEEEKEIQRPQFVFCGTDFRDGRPFYFTHNSVGKLVQDSSKQSPLDIPERQVVGLLQKITIAEAVAASSSYPIAFHPLLIKYKKGDKELMATVTDGGLYDNLGMDVVKLPCGVINDPVYLAENGKYTLSKSKKDDKDSKSHQGAPHRFIFVSDGGGIYAKVDHQGTSFAPTTALRVIDCIGSQVNRLRTSWIREAIAVNARKGALWQLNDVWEFGTRAKVPKRLQRLQELGFMDLGGEFGKIEENKKRIFIEKLTSIRTDLDSFTHGESRTVEMMGYYLASIQLLNKEIRPIWKFINHRSKPLVLPRCHKAFSDTEFEQIMKSISNSDAGFVRNKWNRLWSWFSSDYPGEVIIDEEKISETK